MKNLIYPCKKPKLKPNRRVGFEFEYSNLEIQNTAKIVAKEYNGKIIKVNPYYYKIDTTLGIFKVVLDFSFLTNSKLKELNRKVGIKLDEETIDLIESLIAQIGKSLIPYELTTPPISFDNINEAHNIKELLRKAKALGTRANILYAFGMHINIEARSFEVEEILKDLRAFFILYDFLKDILDVDISRRLTTYIDPFDSSYILKVLDFSYKPTIDEFIDDYIAYNPTRNRALDLLPLLAFIDEKRVRDKLPEEKIGKRPTYHYRLPDSRVDETTWSPCFGLNSWILVEELANNIKLLENLSVLKSKYLQSPWNLLQKDEFESELYRWVESIK